MASNKTRSKNDTWTSEELRMALKEEDAAGKKSHREKSSTRKRTKDEEDKGVKKDLSNRRRLLREEEEEEARKLKEARKAKKSEQNARSHAATDEEEQRRKRREQRAKEGNAVDEDEEERRRRRHERKLKERNLAEDDEEERRQKRREQRKKEHNIIDKDEEQRQKRHERKSKDEKHLADQKDEEERRRRRHERKLKEANQIDEDEEERRRRKREQKTKEGSAPDKDEEERRRRHERKREGKGTERDDDERRRQRHERKVKEETQEDEEENQRRRRRHEKRSKDGNAADNDEEERRRRRHERKLKEGKVAEEDLEERHHQKKERHKKESEKAVYQERKSSGDKNLDNLKKSKKSKHEEVNYKNEKQEQMAKGDIKESHLQSAQKNLETEISTNQDDYNYEDEDFEDYSDDFDDDSLPGNSSNQENAFKEDTKENMERSYLSSADSRSWDSARVSSAEKSSSSVSERPAYQVMDFSNAKMRKMTQKTKSKLQIRSDDLSNLIALDVAVGQEIFELAPISEYELYIRNFGKANSSQAYVQTGDDNIDRDIQTEEIEYSDKWTQHPSNGRAACGGNSDQNFIQTDFADKSQFHDSAGLNKFLLQATQVISILLEENQSCDTHNLAHQKSSQLPFSKSFFTLSSCPLFQELTIDCCCFASSTHTDNLLTVHNPPMVTRKEKNGKKIKSLSGSYIALWDLRTPSRPNQILYSESIISCCFGSLKSQFVLAGCVDGAVVVWDLRESESLHKLITFKDMEYHVRYPAYNTAGVLSFNSHCSTIQTIRDIPLQFGREIETSIQKERFSSQLLSMDQSGVVNLWVIVELSAVDPSGSPVDLGLSPGSRIKLEHTSSINVHAAVRDSLFPTSINTQQLCLLPNDPNQIYIATDTGHVIHSVRLGSQPYPRVHCPRKLTLSSVLSDVLSLDFSPFKAPCFLTGHSDGSVNLYHTSLECPVVTWLPSQTGTESIICVRWSQSRPTVFYALNDSSTLFAFDLLEHDNNVVCAQTYEDRLTSINIICNSNTNTEKSEALEKMVLCFANGRIEVHTISEVFSECRTLEVERLETYLHRL